MDGFQGGSVRGMLVGVGRSWPLRPAGQFVSSVEGVRGGQGGAGAVLAGGLVQSREIENLEFCQILKKI